jgi:hypothetical protein
MPSGDDEDDARDRQLKTEGGRDGARAVSDTECGLLKRSEEAIQERYAHDSR